MTQFNLRKKTANLLRDVANKIETAEPGTSLGDLLYDLRCYVGEKVTPKSKPVRNSAFEIKH